ncbi:MAG: acetylxylan esterase [Pyrinomonadaceae bacterium]
MKRLFLCLLLLLLAPLSEAAHAQVKPFPELARAFDYDTKAPLDIKEHGVEERGGIKVHDISYTSPKGGQVSAYLVVPAGRGPFAGLVFMHPDYGARTAFLSEALLMAEAGAVSLLIDAPYRRSEPSRRTFDFTKPEGNRDLFIQTIIDLRRGVDLLASRSDVDAKRIGYVGHSYGGSMGGVLASVEKRIKAYVLMAGDPSWTTSLRSGTDPNSEGVRKAFTKEQIDKYIEVTAPFDAIHYIDHAKPAALLFQFARYDVEIPEAVGTRYTQAASMPKLVKWYDVGHELDNVEALRDRAAWLRKEIGIAPLAPILAKRLGREYAQ